MRFKRWMTLLLALMMAIGTASAAQAAPSIQIGGLVGFMYTGSSVTLRPRVTGLTAGSISYASSDASVATIAQDGRIQALAPGRTVITVSGGGTSARCGVVVLPRSVSVPAGQTVSLPNGTVEAYRVKDPAIAAISRYGVIYGRQPGTTLVALKYGRQVMIVEVQVTGSSVQPTPSATTAVQTDAKVAFLDCAATASQIVLVEYAGGSSATLSVHEKVDGVWRQLGETPAYVGKNGIGKTREGDKRTPTGTYNLTTPFGILADPGAQMPYTQVTKYHYWCGSSSSGYYNQLVDSRVTGRSYTASDEHLIDYRGAYNYCLFIDYNAAGVAGKGSCIFLHCFSKNKYTAGCVAISEAAMRRIIQWVRPGAKIVIK